MTYNAVYNVGTDLTQPSNVNLVKVSKIGARNGDARGGRLPRGCQAQAPP